MGQSTLVVAPAVARLDLGDTLTLQMQPAIYAMQHRLRGSFWWFIARRELFERLLADLPGLDSTVLLDIGPGPGTNSDLYRLTRGLVVTLDHASETYRLWKPGPEISAIRGDVCAIPLGSETVDVVLLLDVLEHVEDVRAALAEIHRIVAPGGYLLVSVPAFMALWSWHDVQNGHRHRYTSGELGGLLAGAGFTGLKKGYFNFIMSIPAFFIRQMTRRLESQRQKLETDFFPSRLNGVFLSILRLERVLIGWGVRFPWGASCFALTRKAASEPSETSQPDHAAGKRSPSSYGPDADAAKT